MIFTVSIIKIKLKFLKKFLKKYKMCLSFKKNIQLLCSLIKKFFDQRTQKKFKIRNRQDLILWVYAVLETICELSNLQKRLMLNTCNRIINSYIDAFKVRRRLWKAVAISTVWLAVKAYGIDEEEEQLIDAGYMNELCPDVSRDQIITFEMLIFRHVNYQVIGQEKEILNSYKIES